MQRVELEGRAMRATVALVLEVRLACLTLLLCSCFFFSRSAFGLLRPPSSCSVPFRYVPFRCSPACVASLRFVSFRFVLLRYVVTC